MQQKLSLNRALLISMLLPLGVFIAMAALSLMQTRYANNSAALITGAEEELLNTVQVLTAVTDNETGSRGFILTGKQEFLEPLEKSKKTINKNIAALSQLIKNDPRQQKNIDSLFFYANKRIAFSDSTVAARKQFGLEAAANMVSTGRGKLYMDRIRFVVANIQQETNLKLAKTKADNLRAINLEKITMYLIAFVIFSLLLIVFWKEKKRIEQKLVEDTNNKLASLSLQLNQSNDAIYTLDAGRKIKSWNKGAENLYGFTKEEALEMDSNELLQTNFSSDEILIAVIEIAEKNHWTGELERVTKNGEAISVFSSTSCIRNAKGTITGYVSVSYDITAQKRLRERVNHLASIVEQSSEAIFSTDLNQRIISWNSGAEELFGYSKAEVIGKTAAELGFIKLSTDEIAAIELQVNAKGGWKSEVQYFHKDGHSFYGAVTGNRIKNEKGEATSFYFIIKDISLRKQLEQQLRKANEALEEKVLERTKSIIESEKKYRYLFENNPLPMWVIDLSTFDFLDVNEMAVEHYGYSRAEFLSMKAIDIRPEEDKESFLQTDHSHTPDPEKSNRGIWRHVKKDGSIIQVEIHAHPIVFENKAARLILANDVTEKNKAENKLAASEKRYRTLIENNSDVITLMDESFELIYRSPAAARVTGWTDEDMMNIDATKNIHPDDVKKARSIVREVKANPGKRFNTLFRNLHKDGHYIWMEGVLTNWLQDENVQAIVFNYHDVTERIAAEEKLAASEIRFRMLIENCADGIDLSDEFSNNIYLSPGAEKITGPLPKENSLSLAHPDDLAMIKCKREELMNNPGVPVPFQARFRHALGHYFWMEGTFTNLLHLQGVNGIVTNFRDITKRKELEDLLNMANTLAQIGGWEVDLIKGTVFWSAITREIHETPEAYIPNLKEGLNFYKEGKGRDLITQKVKEAIESGIPWDVELQIITAKNNLKWIRSIGQTEFVNGQCVRVYGSFQDIDRRKKAEVELASSEKRFRALIENNYDVISLMDQSFKVIYRSPSAERITGWGGEEMANAAGTKNIHPDDLEYARGIIRQVIANPGKSINTLFRNQHKQGHYLWMEGKVVNMLHDESINAIVFNYRDVTERINAEDKLTASEKRFRALVENNFDIITLIDASFKIIYWSPSVSRVMGFSVEEMEAMEGSEKVHPDDKLTAQQAMQQAIANPGKPANAIFRTLHKDGHYLSLQGVITNMLHDESIKAFVTNFRDVTEELQAKEKLVNSEKLYRNLFTNMLNGFAYCKAIFEGDKLIDYTYLDVNREYEELTGLQDVTGKNMSQLMPDLLDSDPAYAKLMTNVVLNGKYEKFETYVASLQRWFSVSLYSPGKGYFVTLVDNITERREAEEKIKNLNLELEEKVIVRTEQLRKTNEELEAFSYSVSHDLRAPLRAIIGYTNILEEDYGSKLDDEARRVTSVIKNNTARMGNLIDDLLAFSRMSRHEIVKTTIDTNNMVDEVRDLLDKAKQREEKITWIIHPLQNSKADSATIRQVWTNLMSNALKYSGKTYQPVIEIGSFEKDGQTVFYIKDNGVGFDEKYKNKLFKVFQRLHSAEQFEGTGIGLAIVDKIVSKHGGHVWAEAIINKGASFYFSLPKD